MTLEQFKIWLIQNKHTQKSLAETLGINAHTITRYVNNERFPKIFCLALNGLENKK